MVAVIKTGHSLSRIINYNEHKVKEGVADQIVAVNYARSIEKMGFTDKLRRLEKLSSLNPNVTRLSVHVSINFDPAERLNKATLEQIARRYMEGIGFGEQPYLVYEHRDAGHPHLHIVSVKVRPDGSRIDMNNIGKNQSEKVRLEIERAFHLVKAKKETLAERQPLKLVPVAPLRYGKQETRKAINQVLQQVITRFNYTSLPELNAVLRMYNVEACPGQPGSRVARHAGLQYRILGPEGQKLGVPVKASAFALRPTLAMLTKQMEKNKLPRTSLRHSLAAKVEPILTSASFRNVEELAAKLVKEGLVLVERRGKENVLYGVTYIDLYAMSVFNGSELGKGFSAKAILAATEKKMTPEWLSSKDKKQSSKPATKNNSDNLVAGLEQLPRDLMEALFQEERANQAIPFELRQQALKKKNERKL